MNGNLRAKAIREYNSIKIILGSEVFTFSRNSKKQAELKREADKLKRQFNL